MMNQLKKCYQQWEVIEESNWVFKVCLNHLTFIDSPNQLTDVRFLHVINYLHVSIIGSYPQGVAYFISVFTIFITLSVWV